MEKILVVESSFRILGGHGGYFVVEGPDGMGVIDHEGKSLVPARFHDVRLCPWNGEVEVFICRHREGEHPNPRYLFDLVDTDGHVLSEGNYGECIGFSEGLGVVRDAFGLKVINVRGEEVFELSGDWLSPGCCEADFHDKMLRVAARPGFYSCYVDHWGDRVSRAYQHAGDFHCGLAVVSVERPMLMKQKYGAIDRSGKWAVHPKYDYMDAFHSHRARVMKRGKWGYVNTEGELHIPMVWDTAGNFDSKGFAFVSKDRSQCSCIITWHGQVALRLPKGCTFARSFFENMLAAKTEAGWGFVGHDGGWGIAPQFDAVGDFCGGVAPVKRCGSWCFIDKNGNELMAVDGELKIAERGLAHSGNCIYNYGYSKPASLEYSRR